ncbi:MAG TPA: YggT family protein [Acidimicrobiales bacterium]|nr:YggT family protein [Acidimicrobiales bacterium]
MISTLIRLVLELFIVVLFAYAVLSWVETQVAYDSPVRKVQRVLAAICDPVLYPIRRIVPPARIGSVGIDLSVLIVFLLIQVVIIPLV